MTSDEQAPKTTAASVGRGGLAVFAAKVYFILIGFVQQTVLRWAMGEAGYGALSRVLAPANIVDNVVVTSSVQGVSRAVAGAGENRQQALRAALRIHAPLAFVIAALFFVLCPAYAVFQKSPHIERPLHIVAGVVLLYGLYAPLVGALNGQAQFTKQAALDTIFATVRTFGLVGVALLFAKYVSNAVDGAVTGFVLAALFIIPIALRWAGTGKSGDGTAVPRARPYLTALAPLALAQLCANGLMQADLVVLGRYLSQGAVDSGLVGDAAMTRADEWVAVYRGCQFFAFLPYQLVLSIAQILFPMVARAHAGGDTAAVKLYVARGARISAIACGLFVVVIATMPETVLTLGFGKVIAARGAASLRVLVVGQGAFTLFGIGTTVLASLGRERVSAALSFLLLVLLSVGVWLASSRASFGEAQLMATARATSVTLAVGFVAMLFAVRRFAGAFVPAMTLARVLAMVALFFAFGLYIPRVGLLWTPVVALGVAIAYLVGLIVLRELSGEDLAMVRSLVNRRGGR